MLLFFRHKVCFVMTTFSPIKLLNPMELSTSAINHYQKNQNLAGWLQQSEAASASANELADDDGIAQDVMVELTNRQDVFRWIAAQFPVSENSPENISQTSQRLYDYQIIGISEVNQLNEIQLDKAGWSIVDAIEQQLTENNTYQSQQTLKKLKQVFSTLMSAAPA